MREKPKRSKSSIIIVGAVVVVMIAMMVLWQQYESKHKEELRSFLAPTAEPEGEINMEVAEDLETRPTKPKRIIPDDPEKILIMAEEAFADEDYFEPDDTFKGFHVYSLLKKCLNCNGDPDKVEEIATRLAERASKTYGAWYVESDLLVDLNESIKKSKEQI